MAGIRRIINNLLTRQGTPVLSRSELAEQGATEQEYEVTRDASAAAETPTEPVGVPISALPGASTPTEDDIFPGVQDDTTVRYKLANLLSWIISQIVPADIGAVPDTRTVNNHALSSDVTVTAADVGAVPTSRTVNGKALSADITLTASDVGARPDSWTPSAADVGAQPAVTASGILKGDGLGGISAAAAGTDYQTPLVAGTDYQTPLTFDTAPTENSQNPVTSGGLYSSLVNHRYSETTLFSTTTDVHSDTTVTMSKPRSAFKLFSFLFNSRSSSNAGTRMPLTIPYTDLVQGGFYPLRNSEVDGYVRINIVSGQNAQVRIQASNIATLYLISITGLQ